MHRAALRALGFFVLIATAPTLVRAQTIDQQQATHNETFDYFNFLSYQTFKPTASNVSGAGFKVRNEGWMLDAIYQWAVISLWDGDPGSVASQMLAQGRVSFELGYYQPSWIDAFWSPVSVTSGATYWLSVRGGSSEITTLAWEGAGGYEGGNAHYDPMWMSDPDGTPISVGDRDLAFRTYSDGTVIATPEPASIALISTGLAALSVVRRRRRR